MYHLTIRSISQMHPTLADNEDVLDVRVFQGVNASKEIGSPIDPLAAQDADSTVALLSVAQRKHSVHFTTTTKGIVLREPPRGHHKPGHRDRKEPGLYLKGNP
jgi:hypothetical protein